MRGFELLAGWPPSVVLPLGLSLVVPVLLGLLLLRRRGVSLATVLGARGLLALSLGFAVIASVATISVLHAGLRELHGRHLRETVFVAQDLSSRLGAPGATLGVVRPRLALFRAERANVGMVAVTWSPCAGDCTIVLADVGNHAAEAWVGRIAARPDAAAGLVVLGGVPYLGVTSALRDRDGVPRGRLIVAVDAGQVVRQATTTAWLLVSLAHAMLLISGWWGRRMLRASVASRIHTLIDTLERPAVITPGAPATPRVSDELGVLSDALKRHIERSLARQRESEERYRRLVEGSPDAIMVYRDGHIVFLNEAGVRLCGVRVAPDLVGAPVAQVLTLGAPSGTATPPQRPGARQAMPVREGRLLRADGVEVDVEVAEIPFADEGGTATQAVIRDVSDRKRAEGALRRSEADYRALVEHATYGMFRAGLGPHFLAVNPALVRILGYASEAELLAVDMAQEIYARPAERLELMERYAHASRIEGLEVEWRRKDGTPIIVRLSGQPTHDEAGRLTGFEMIAEDISEQRILEEQLRQAQKMEAVGRFTGGVAHDFNNLLTIILSNAELLGKALPSGAADAHTELDELKVATRRGAALVRKLLAFSRAERLDIRPVSSATLLGELGFMLRRILPEHIEIRMPASVPGSTVLADAAAVEQIVLNLATNARDAMPDGGTLTLTTDLRVVDRGYCEVQGWGAPGVYFCLTVRDTGHGMDEPTRARVFEPFFTTKSPESGTGLGMSIVYGLMRHHRGFVEVDSGVSRGTEVRILLPTAPGATEEEVPVSVPGPLAGGTEVILVVEDEESIRRATQKVLERRGYTVLTASDGEEALALVRSGRRRVDLIVSDLMMPKMGGRALYEALRDEGLLRPFLFISGYSTEVMAGARELQRDAAFLHKPWELGELVSKVREVLDRKSSLDGAMTHPG